MVNQLGNGSETLSITDANAAPRQVRYITDNQMETKSAKELYYCWLSRLVMLFAVLSLGFFTSASLVLFKLAPEVMVEPFLLNKTVPTVWSGMRPLLLICRLLTKLWTHLSANM